MKEHYHGSPVPITVILDEGLFGGLFGAASETAALSHGDVLHIIESPRPLSDFELNYQIEGAYELALELANGNERIADAIMSAECGALDDCEPEMAGEQEWEFQRLRGALAVRLGYTSVEMIDEHGTTWLCMPGCTISQVAADNERDIQVPSEPNAQTVTGAKNGSLL